MKVWECAYLFWHHEAPLTQRLQISEGNVDLQVRGGRRVQSQWMVCTQAVTSDLNLSHLQLVKLDKERCNKYSWVR